MIKILEAAIVDGSPAVKARARKLLAQVNRQ